MADLVNGMPRYSQSLTGGAPFSRHVGSTTLPSGETHHACSTTNAFRTAKPSQ